MMNDFIVAIELFVLLAERLQAMRTRRNNFLHVIVIQRLHVFVDQSLREILVPHPACGIAVAFLFRTQDCELDSCKLHQLCKALRYFFVTGIVRPGASYPE